MMLCRPSGRHITSREPSDCAKTPLTIFHPILCFSYLKAQSIFINMNHIIGNNRDQMMMISLNQMVHKESFVRVIDAFVNAIDMDSFGFTKSVHAKEGRPPYHPSDLLKLWFYGYRNNLRSCRKLEHSAKVNLEVIWLLKSLQPHYKTIAEFRKDNKLAFQKVFRQFVLLLKDWKLVDGKHVAIDSFKVRAQNSLKNNYNQKKIDRHLNYIDDKIKGYLKDFNEIEDKEEKKMTE